MILIINENGYRLCNDKRWRDFAMFGNVKGCVKEYRSLGHALNRAKHIKGIVVKIPDGMEVDASGNVIETTPAVDKPGYVNYKHHKMIEYAVNAVKREKEYPAAIKGELRYVEFDKEFEEWGIFGDHSGHCYAMYATEEIANDKLAEFNIRMGVGVN